MFPDNSWPRKHGNMAAECLQINFCHCDTQKFLEIVSVEPQNARVVLCARAYLGHVKKMNNNLRTGHPKCLCLGQSNPPEAKRTLGRDEFFRTLSWSVMGSWVSLSYTENLHRLHNVSGYYRATLWRFDNDHGTQIGLRSKKMNFQFFFYCLRCFFILDLYFVVASTILNYHSRQPPVQLSADVLHRKCYRMLRLFLKLTVFTAQKSLFEMTETDCYIWLTDRQTSLNKIYFYINRWICPFDQMSLQDFQAQILVAQWNLSSSFGVIVSFCAPLFMLYWYQSDLVSLAQSLSETSHLQAEWQWLYGHLRARCVLCVAAFAATSLNWQIRMSSASVARLMQWVAQGVNRGRRKLTTGWEWQIIHLRPTEYCWGRMQATEPTEYRDVTVWASQEEKYRMNGSVGPTNCTRLVASRGPRGVDDDGAAIWVEVKEL